MATTTMSAVWDRTVLVLEGRGRMLATIAALTLFAPTVVRGAMQAFADPASPVATGIVGLVGIALLAVSLWGQLALIAAASDPAVLQGDAFRMAARRLPAAIGVALAALLVVMVLSVPVIVVMARSGLTMQTMAAGANTMTVPPAVAGFVSLYTLALLVASLVIGARLIVLYPVVLLERHGILAFAVSFALTRGLFWRILGVLLLYLIVLVVASGAAKLVVGTLVALIAGPGATAVFVATLAAALVAAVFSTLAAVFTAQLYLALRDARAAS